MSGRRVGKGEDGGWSIVRRKTRLGEAKGRWESFSKVRRSRLSNEYEEKVTTLYISEFPEFSSARELYELFRCVGDVVEVSILPRRNKVGKRFGFTRFVENQILGCQR